MKVKIIAEAGLNHNGNFENAKRLIDIGKNSGADYVKFQLYDTKELYNQYINTKFKKVYKRFFKREFSLVQWNKLISYSKKKKIKLFFSVFDIKSLKMLKKFKINIVKVPSGEITNYPLLKEIKKMKLNVIISTGMASYKEINKSVNLLKGCNIILMHCVSEYPTINPKLNYIKFLKKKFPNCKIGFSDHTKEIFWPAMSIYHGAEFIEKHFTFNKNIKLGDHHMSLNQKELKEMVDLVRINQNYLKIINKKEISIGEKILRNHARKGVYFSKNMKKNEKVKYSSIKILRPLLGLGSEKINSIIGKVLKRDVKAYQPISISFFKN